MRKLARSLRLRPATGAACRPAGRAGLLCAGLWLAGGWLAGCTRPDPAVVSLPAPAELVVVNLSDRVWEVALTTGNGADRRWRVEPWVTRREVLAAGKYQGEQVLLTPNGEQAASRELEIVLDAGKSYRWRLTTLQARAAPRGTDGSELGDAVR